MSNQTNILQYLENTPHPQKPAFINETTTLTFAQLQQLSQSAGSYLCTKLPTKQPIPVFMEKSPHMIAAFFAVLYSGNYYIPLDAEMPKNRIAAILEMTNPAFVICDHSTQHLVEGYPTLDFSHISQAAIDPPALDAVRAQATDTDPAYIVFTSGSTGIPKGVVTHHRGVIDYVNALCPVLNVTENTVFGNQSPLYLDACLKELMPTLKYGATTYLIPKQLFMFPIKLVEYINEKGINTICWVASALSLVAGLGTLDKLVPHSLTTVAFGSEIFPVKHLTQWQVALPHAQFVHLYGPTEATGMSTFYMVNRCFNEGEKIPIGKAFPNREALLIDEEIHLRGGQLSTGYFKNPEQTAKAFVQNPHAPYPDILYKTGDLGELDKDGNLIFISRKDHQIKHMGHRIELAEIEVAARALPDVAMACAIFDNPKSRIVLFYTGAAENIAPKLKQALPRYMVPQHIYQLETLPFTAGGKIDRVGLMANYKERTTK